jgi:hypothetical protein
VITKDEWPQRLEMTKTDALSEQNAALFAVWLPELRIQNWLTRFFFFFLKQNWEKGDRSW